MRLQFRFVLHSWSFFIRSFFIIFSTSDITSSQPNPGSQFVTRRVNEASMRNFSNKLSDVFNNIRCNVVKAGIKCNNPGLQQRWGELSQKIYTTQGIVVSLLSTLLLLTDFSDLSVLEDILVSKDPEFGLLPQISGTFDDASKMLILLRDNLENLIIRRHRIAKLTPQDYSAIPEYDPTNPRLTQILY